MRLKSFLIPLSVLLLSSCAKPQDNLVYAPPEKVPVILQASPTPVLPSKVTFKVVTEENLQEFLASVNNTEGKLVFIAISVKDYERLALNTQELVRYVKQQKEIIVYYERILTDDEPIL